MNTPEQFNAAYYNSLPLEAQFVLKTTLPFSPERSQGLASVADLKVDQMIMVGGFDPYKVMWARHMYGYTWVPNASQGNVGVPGISISGRPMYDPQNPPVGSILVPNPDNCDLAKWYPPVAKPPAPKPKPAPVGPFVGEQAPELTALLSPEQQAKGVIAYHALKFQDGIEDGAEITEKGKVFIKQRFWNFATTIPYYIPKV